MKRNNIIRIALPLVASAMLLPSCSFEQDDVFDTPSAQRVQKINEELQKTLVEASTNGGNGWVIQYFVRGTAELQFEGFNLFAKFDNNGKVTFASDHRYLRDGKAGIYTEASSNYEMQLEDGPMISFNTWNDVLTVFEDPYDPTQAPKQLIPDGVGMGGDHNFVLRKLGNDTILFRGQTNSSHIRFIKLDCTGEQYLQKVEDYRSQYINDVLTNYYLFSDNNATKYVQNIHTGHFDVVDRLIDPLYDDKFSCVYTPSSIYIPNALSGKGFSATEWGLSEDRTSIVPLNGYNESNARIVAMWDQYICDYNSYWSMNEVPAAVKDKFDNLAAILKGINSGWELTGMGIGHSTGGKGVDGLVFSLKTQSPKEKTIGMSLNHYRSNFAETTLEMYDNPEYDINLGIIADKTTADIKTLLKEFGEALCGTYKLTPDDYFLPTSFTMTSGDGNVISLTEK